MSEKLKPCPFCGGEDIKYSLKTTRISYKRKYHASFYCNSCHVYGPRTISDEIGNDIYGCRSQAENDKTLKKTALEKWNDRPNKEETP